MASLGHNELKFDRHLDSTAAKLRFQSNFSSRHFRVQDFARISDETSFWIPKGPTLFTGYHCLIVPRLPHPRKFDINSLSKLTIIGSDNGLAPTRRQARYLNQCWNIVNFKAHQTIVQWAFYILSKFIESLFRHLALAIEMSDVSDYFREHWKWWPFFFCLEELNHLISWI